MPADIIIYHNPQCGTGEFFRRLGYVDADRDAAPAFIAATAQFTSLCGPRATYLVKDLG